MNDEREAATAEAAERLQRLIDAGEALTVEEADDLRMVLHGLRVYRFERDGANASVERMAGFREQDRRDHKVRMRAIWALVDSKRKSVPMADLRAALTDPIARLDAAAPDPGGMSADGPNTDQQPRS